MTLPKEKNFNKVVSKNFDYEFDASERGTYVIEISAKAKSWYQNFLKSFFRDDNLAIRINGVEFTKISKKRGIFDSEASWNGNDQKGRSQTNVFLINLNEDKNQISFLMKQSPFLEKIRIYKIENNELIYVPEGFTEETSKNNPKLKFIIYNIALKNISVKARAGFENSREDDLQIRIDGQRQKNETPKSHKYWFWCGKILKGQTKTFEKELNLSSGIHYLEFWADGLPILEQVHLLFKEEKRIPTVENPLWTGDFNDDPNEIILARLIFGEARNQTREAKIWVAATVFNRMKSSAWPNIIKKVILQPRQFDSFKSEDPNFPYVINPLKDLSQSRSWQECYSISVDMISGKLEIPTTATHFHSHTKRKDIENFEKNVVPKGKFLRKIGIMRFYWSPN